MIQKSADPDANIIIGAVIDENLKDEMYSTVIATGFDKSPTVKKVDKVPDRGTSNINAREEKPMNQAGNGDELDIPTFLRRNRFNK